MQIVCIDDLVPQDYLLRIIDKAIDWLFIYDLVRDNYFSETGRTSIDPVTLIKIPLSQYLDGIKAACDKNGWIIDFTINPGNEHESQAFKSFYDKLKNISIKYCVVDSGYKTPEIAKLPLDDGVKPMVPYKRPMTKEGFFPKHE